ncbi:pPIWI_RE module domain-containing protein [Streptosporangium canum]|uniref:pPIWI_RE module domain-containing protein n=1 Tax=Streptosporangium canum TaxID=324952 RepID=UPI00341ADA8C
MGFTYDEIRRAAYLLAPGAAPLTARYRVLPFPEHWRDSLLALCNTGRNGDAEPYRTVPTYRMDGVLQSLAPDLVVRGRGSEKHKDGEDFWLYAPADLPHPLPGGTFERLLTAWVRNLRPEPAHRRQVAETLTELRAEPPRWEVVEVDLLGCGTSDGGTAVPLGRQFQLATDHLARRILALDPYDTGAGFLWFRAVPRGPRQQGAELMSQPLPHEVKDRTWWFSVVVNISLHTVPFSPHPRLHIHTGIRRWATHPGAGDRLRLPFRRDTSVYLRPTVPWLPGAPASERYAVARLTWDRTERAHGWREAGPAGILRDIALGQPFPDPAELLTAPELWIGDGPGVRAAVVHSTHMGQHGVKPGLMSHQRSQIAEWAEQALPEGLVRAPDLKRSRISSNTPANSRPKPQKDAKKAEEVRAARARRAALAVAVRALADEEPVAAGVPVMEGRLLWQTAAMRDAAIAALTEVLALEGDGGAPAPEDFETGKPGNPVILHWNTPELNVRLRCLTLSGGLADGLGIISDRRPKGEALAKAITDRRTAIADFLTADGANPDIPTLALVEIDRRADFQSPLDDPKFALRLGCADAGVVTQFTAVPRRAKGYNSEKNAAYRAYSAWLDGLRQLGVRVVPEHTLGDRLPAGLHYAAVRMVKRRADGPTRQAQHTPVAVLVSPVEPGSGQAVVRGWDQERRVWIPYPKFLLRLTRIAEIPGTSDGAEVDAAPGVEVLPSSPAVNGQPRPRLTFQARRRNTEEQRAATARYLQRMIRSLQGRPTLLLAHSQNSRMHWPWLQDSQAVPDLIRTGLADAARLSPDLRLVRVRGADGRETPQWWGVGNPSGVNGLAAGLWTEPATPATAAGRVFYSTTDKAATFRASAVEADKLAPRPLRMGKRRGELTIDTEIPAWNPALMEITVLGCHPASSGEGGDSPEALALAVHQLRQAPDYLDSLSLPLPLHLAALAQEYVLPTVADGDGTADDSSAVDDLAELLGEEMFPTVDESSDPDPEPAIASDLTQVTDLEEHLPLFT